VFSEHLALYTERRNMFCLPTFSTKRI